MANNPNVLVSITAEDIAGWEAEEQKLLQRLGEVREKLRAAAILSPQKVRHKAHPAYEGTPVGSGTGTLFAPVEVPEDNLTDAIERIANATNGPITKADLKEMLAKEGYAKDRLANYFYTAIHRLKNKNRITVTPTGSIWYANAKI